MKPCPREPSPTALPKRAEKAFTKERLSRLFFSKEIPKPTAPQNGVAAANPVFPPSSVAGPSPHTSTPEALSTDTIVEELTLFSRPTKLEGGNNVLQQRFVMHPGLQGGHEHYLKPREHQERLFGIWRKLLSKGQEAEKKGGPNSLATMVEKYGKCREVVGGGASGIVRISHKMDNRAGEELYAVKEFRRRPGETDNKYSKRLMAEFCISSELCHPNVIRTLDLFKGPKGDYYEVMEFCTGGDLFTLVHSAGKLGVQEADCFFKQLMHGVKYMHEMGVAHRDLKPENLLLTRHGRLKISDFDNSECFRMAWEDDIHMVSGLCGSRPYIAPEAYTDKEFDGRALDIWACGVIYMAMRTGCCLWHVAKKDEDDLYAQYLDDRRREDGFVLIESLCRARFRNVIYCMLDPNPARRITASQVLNSEWGREIQLCRAVV